MSTLKTFKKAGDSRPLHLSHILMFMHEALFYGTDLSAHKKDHVFQGRRFTIPCDVSETNRRVHFALLDNNALKVIFDTSTEHQKKLKAAGNTPLAVAVHMIRLNATKQAMDSSLRIQFPAIGRVQPDYDVLGDADKAMRWLDSRVKRLRDRHFGSEWVEVKIDHNLGNAIMAQLQRVESAIGSTVIEKPDRSRIVSLSHRPKGME